MNQALAVMTNESGLGFAAPPQQQNQTPKWQSILTSVGAAIPTVIGTYQATRQQAQQQQQLPMLPPAVPQRPQSFDDEDDAPRRRSSGINTNLGFDFENGLNIGGTRIPVLYLALGAGALYLLYREPPKRGR